MAIATDSLIEFFGTQDTLGTTTSAVTNTSFSAGTGDLLAWTNDDDAPFAVFILQWQYASGTVDTDGAFNLYARLIDIQSTNDTPVPDAAHPHVFIGSFPVEDPGAATNAFAYMEAALPNTETSQVYHFYLENQSDVTISAGWDLYVTPKSVGPHP